MSSCNPQINVNKRFKTSSSMTLKELMFQPFLFFFAQGKINSQGSFTELSQSGVDFSELLKRSEEEEESERQKSVGRQHSAGSHLLEAKDCLMTSSHTSLHSMIEDYEVSLTSFLHLVPGFE